MKVFVEPTPLSDVLLVKHEVFRDERGFFMEAYRQDVFAEAGLPTSFVQVNHSRSAEGVLRGLHFQWEPPMGKLMRVVRGKAFLVAVDIRPDSPTVGQWFGTTLDERSDTHVWAPAGFARGFCTLAEGTEILYLTTGTYNPNAESGIRWDDPAIGIDWPVKAPTLSAKDAAAQSLEEWLARPEAQRFAIGGAAPALTSVG